LLLKHLLLELQRVWIERGRVEEGWNEAVRGLHRGVGVKRLSDQWLGVKLRKKLKRVGEEGRARAVASTSAPASSRSFS
jgi:hypothetical protein